MRNPSITSRFSVGSFSFEYASIVSFTLRVMETMSILSRESQLGRPGSLDSDSSGGK